MFDRGKEGEKGCNVQSAIKPDFKMSPGRQVQTQMSWRYFDLSKRKGRGREREGRREIDIFHVHFILELPYQPVYNW